MSFWDHFLCFFFVFLLRLHMDFDIDFGVIFDGFWMVLGSVWYLSGDEFAWIWESFWVTFERFWEALGGCLRFRH